MVDVVEELDEVPRQNVVVVIRVRWVSPPKTQEHWQRGAKAEEIFYPELNDIETGGRIEGDKKTGWKWRKLPEYEAGLCCGGNRGLAQALLPELSSLKVRIGSGFLSKLSLARFSGCERYLGSINRVPGVFDLLRPSGEDVVSNDTA